MITSCEQTMNEILFCKLQVCKFYMYPRMSSTTTLATTMHINMFTVNSFKM